MEILFIIFAWAFLGATGCIVLIRRYRHIRSQELFECIFFGSFFGIFAWLAVLIDSEGFSERIIIRKKDS